MPFSTIFFDLDETLYQSSTGLWSAIRARIHSFMHERLGFPQAAIPALQEKYFRQYGTTLRGLRANYNVDMEEYLKYVHNIPLMDYLQPDLPLRRMLQSLSVKKVIFTNADAAHVNRVVNVLGLDGCFDAVIDVYALEPFCKPMPESFERAMKLVGESDPRCCILIDDLPTTIRNARAFGFFSILVDEINDHEDPPNGALRRLTDLPTLSSIWNDLKKQ